MKWQQVFNAYKYPHNTQLYIIRMSVSHFAQTVNHPLCEYMDSIAFHKANKQKQQLYFLSGDPTAYGNNNFKMPQQGYDIIKKYIGKPDSHGYTITPGVPQAREAIIKLYKPKNAITIDQVTIQHGVNQGLLATLMAFTNPGDEILVPEIGYPIFEKLAPALFVKPVHYPLRHNHDYEIDLEHLGKLVNQKTRFLFVINPSNPMGTVFSLKHMKQILRFCDQHQLPLVSDEVYHGQVFEGVQFNSFGDVTDDVPVLVLCGVQKLLSVPGWSTSWTVIFDKHKYLQQIWKNIMTTGMIFLHTNKFTQLALPQILQKVGLFNQNPIKQTKKIHDELLHKFKEMKGYKPMVASGTFYMTILIDVSSFKDIKDDKQYVEKLLQEQNVALLPLSIFGGSLNGFRLLTCAKPEVYAQLITRIANFNTKHQK